MIDLSGSRGRGFLASTNGSTPQIRELILQTLSTLSTDLSTAQTQINTSTTALLSASTQIAGYLSGWSGIVRDYVSVNATYASWWINEGRPMQDALNTIQDNLTELDQKLTALGR